MKKLLSVLLAVLLVLSMSSTIATAEETEKITIFFPLHAVDIYDEGAAVFGEIAKKYGLELEWITVSEELVGEKTNTLLSSGSIPDIFGVIKNDVPNLYGPDGMFLPLDELIEDNMPNFAKLMSANDISGVKAADGNLYYLPRFAAQYTTTEGTMTYRKDIVEALGEEEPTTVEGWYELYKKVHEAYPDMIVVSERGASTTMIQPVFGMCDVMNGAGYTVQDGLDTIVFLPTSENWKAMLEWYHQLFEEGILYEGYETIDYASWWDQGVCTDKVFACNSQNYWRAHNATITAHDNGYENVQWWVALNPNNPFTNTNEILLNGSAWMADGFAISATCKCPEKVCQFLDWFFGEECEELQIKYMDTPSQELPLHYWPTNKINQYVVSDVEVYVDHFTKNSPLCVQVPRLESNPEDTQRMVDATEGLSNYVNRMKSEFISGVTSLDEWDNYVEECKKLGCEVLVEVAQGFLDVTK